MSLNENINHWSADSSCIMSSLVITPLYRMTWQPCSQRPLRHWTPYTYIELTVPSYCLTIQHQDERAWERDCQVCGQSRNLSRVRDWCWSGVGVRVSAGCFPRVSRFENVCTLQTCTCSLWIFNIDSFIVMQCLVFTMWLYGKKKKRENIN
jgi:hypothetical protein